MLAWVDYMKIALVGGTGDIGMGFALRWAPEHEIIIGSRKADKALESAKELLARTGGQGKIWGTDNGSAIKAGEIVVLCVPYEHLRSVTADLKDSYTDQLVVSPVVPMAYTGKLFAFTPPSEGSAAVQARAWLPEKVRLISAFHTICAAALQDTQRSLQGDVFICGDDPEAKELVKGLAREVKNLRPLDVGPLAASGMIESLTPMLLNVARRNKIKDAGIKIVQEKP
jgi:8-hydroxy-5-deazaflavin:NADPH oxidoreductase